MTMMPIPSTTSMEVNKGGVSCYCHVYLDRCTRILTLYVTYHLNNNKYNAPGHCMPIPDHDPLVLVLCHKHVVAYSGGLCAHENAAADG